MGTYEETTTDSIQHSHVPSKTEAWRGLVRSKVSVAFFKQDGTLCIAANALWRINPELQEQIPGALSGAGQKGTGSAKIGHWAYP